MQKNISEENANNQKIIYSQNDESKATDGSRTEESTSLQEVSKQIEKLFKLNTELKGQILDLTKTNSNLQNRMNIVEKKIKGLEALVIHNNINMDFISNRDSLKTLLLIVGVNLKVVSEPEIKSICQNFVSKVKFTKLILKILDNLSMKLNPKELPWRRGMEKEKNDQVLSEEEKKKIIHNIIFVECIHFIVCCIDNIVHPPDKIDNNENGNIYSKLMGKRSQDNLEKGLFNRDMNEKKEKKNSEIKQEETNTNENIKDNEKRNTNIKIPKNIDENLYNENIDIMQKANTIAFENYDLSKQYTYIQNKKFYEELNGKNEYIDKFYIQYLFDPNKNEFPGLNINYQEFKNKMDKEFEKFNNMKFDVKANELIKNLKWIS